MPDPLLELIEQAENEPNLNRCKCDNCGWEGPVEDCEQTEESEGWEYPTYKVYLCPNCNSSDPIINYWYEEEEKSDGK